MKMTKQEALRVLRINEKFITKDLIKNHYRQLARKYHPDKNPDGLRAMQEVNVARDYLFNMPDDAFSKKAESDELGFLRSCGLNITVKNRKTYITGKTFPWREFLKKQGFRWSRVGKVWWRYNLLF